MNEFTKRLHYIFRGVLKYGDQFFLRDPETGEWLWLDQYQVEMIKVDDERGKQPDEYIIRGLDYNKVAKYASSTADPTQYRTPLGALPQATGRPANTSVTSGSSTFNLAGSHRDPRQQKMQQQTNGNEMYVIDAKHVVHLSLSGGGNFGGFDVNWPFGNSVLEPIYKTYKQKELLEDAIIIYRVQRAPERRIFYIDVGNMPPVRARAHIEQIKNEIHQRRIPNRTGGGNSIVDAAYNPLSIMEDYFFAQSADGRGSKVETLAGADNLGEIGDLSFFTKKMARGLRIPPSYLSLSDDDQQVAYNDGKLGGAMIQEFRFNKYCMRLQALLAPVFDREFKKFLRDCGIEIDPGLFTLTFHAPQNFTKYRQIELDAAQVNVFSQVASIPWLSKRFIGGRFLNLTEDELLQNEKMWAEENAEKLRRSTGSTPADDGSDNGNLGSIGIRPTTDIDMNFPPADGGGDEEMSGDEGMDQSSTTTTQTSIGGGIGALPGGGGAASPLGGAPPA